MKVCYVCLSILLACCVFAGCAPSSPVPPSKTASTTVPSDASHGEDLSEEDLLAMNNGNVEIHRDPKSGIPKEINGIFSSQIVHSPEDAITALMSVRTLMHISQPDFIVTDVDEERRTRIAYTLQQVCQGVPVENGLFYVYTTKDGTPVGVQGVYIPCDSLDTVPTVSREEAIERLSESDRAHADEPELVIYTKPDNTVLLTWKILLNDFPNITAVYIDAQNGQSVAIRPLVIV